MFLACSSNVVRAARRFGWRSITGARNLRTSEEQNKCVSSSKREIFLPFAGGFLFRCRTKCPQFQFIRI